MKVLVACEESGRVAREFRKRGHIAYSCDIMDCSGSGEDLFYHIKKNVFDYIDMEWDMIIAFPPCTYLTNAGTRHFSERCTPKAKVEARKLKRIEAYKFVMRIANNKCPKIVIENPVGWLNSQWRKPDQVIHPYYFGEPVQKRTCLWLKGVDKLEYTNMLDKPEPVYVTTTGKNINWCESVTKDRAKERSKTFISIAKAMANQWG